MKTMASRLLLALTGTLILLAVPSRTSAQSYYYSFGAYPWTTPIPVPGGYMDAANGNLHIAIPIASVPERGRIPFVASLVYDSHIWQQALVGGAKTWQPTNVSSVPTAWGGWRLVTSTGTGARVSYSTNNSQCEQSNGNIEIYYNYSQYYPFRWTSPEGHVITFDNQTVDNWGYNPCMASIPSSTGHAIDGSGYSIAVTNYTTAVVYAPDGTQVYPNVKDTNGNYYSAPNSNGDVTDTLGQMPMTTAANGNTTTYKVLNSTGGTSTFTVTTGSIPAHTSFGQSGVTECTTSCNVTVIQSIGLPDGTSYQFAYDQGSTGTHYGTLTGMTLPTGGTISYTNEIFKDAFGNYYLYLSGSTAGSGTWSYSPQVITTCGTTCSQKMIVTQPSGDQKQYTFTMHSSAMLNTSAMWNTAVDSYTGSVSSGTLLRKVSTAYSTAAPIQPIQVTTTYPLPSGSLSKQAKITWDTTNYGNVVKLAEWLFEPTSFSSTADRTTAFAYLANSNNTMVNKQTQVAVYAGSSTTASSETVTNYDEVATSSQTGAVNHDDTNFGTSYSPRGNPTSIVRSPIVSGLDLKTVLAYDMTGQVKQVTDPNVNITKFSYTDNYFKDSSSGQTTTTASGNTNAYVTQITLPSTWTISFGYFLGSGKVANKMDQNGAKSTFDFMDCGTSDCLDRPSQTVLPTGWSVFSYSTPSGYETQVDKYLGIADTSPSAGCSSCRHDQLNLDNLGRVSTRVLVSDIEGADTVTTSYDSASSVHNVTNPERTASSSTDGSDTYSYDGLGRIIKVLHTDATYSLAYYGANVTAGVGGITAQLCPASTYGYGFPALFVDEAAKKRQTWTDAFGRNIEVDEPDNSGNLTLKTCYTHDVLGNLTKVTQGTQTRSYTYDGLSRATQAVTPESGTVKYGYTTSSGTLCSGSPSAACSRTDARNIITTYAYDNLNRLTGISYTGSTPAVTYTYDSGTNQKGFRTGMTDGSGSAIWTYNAMGWPLTESRIIKVGSSNTSNSISYTYNQDGSLAALTYPSGRTITYSTSNAQRLLSAKDIGNSIQYAVTASYAPPGEVNGVFYGPAGGITEKSAYNSRLEVTSTSATVGSATAQSLTFDYASPTGNNGTITSIQNNAPSGIGESFTYDSLDRILTAATSTTSGAGCWGNSFGPVGPPPPGPPDDAWSNLTQINVTQCTAGSLSVIASSASNQVTTTGYLYDLSGNMTQEASAFTYTYQYDAENHLTQASGMFGGPWNYVHDGKGLRVQKSTSASNGTLYWRAITGVTIAETDTTGSTTNSAYEEYIFFGGQRIASRTASGTVNYYYADQVGSTVTMTDASGNRCYQATFTPYGEEHTAQTPTCSTNYKFTGYERDAETGLDYAFARFYNSRLGRFMGPDPLAGGIHDPQSLNRYAYTINNPTNFADPTGLCSPAGPNCLPPPPPPSNNCTIDGAPATCDQAEELLSSGAGAECPGICGPLTGSNGYLYLRSLSTEGWGYINPLNGDVFYGGSEYGLPDLGEGNDTVPAGSAVVGSAGGSGTLTCPQKRILNAIPGAQLSNPPYDVNQGGHEQMGISTTAADLTAAGFAPFSLFGANGYRDSAVFWSIHVNGQYGAQLTANGPFTSIQAHIDLFNPSTGLFGILGHATWDLGIGSLFFHHSSALDPSCH